jgi:hypothetical protein
MGPAGTAAGRKEARMLDVRLGYASANGVGTLEMFWRLAESCLGDVAVVNLASNSSDAETN